MVHVISGTSQDSVGQLIAGYFSRNSDSPVTGAYTAIGWVDDGKLVGQALFNDYTGANLEIHLHYPKGISRKTVKHVYEYVFKQLKCKRLTAKPLCTNEKLLRVLERLGFVYEFTQKDYAIENGEAVDVHVYKLTPDTVPKWVNLNGR